MMMYQLTHIKDRKIITQITCVPHGTQELQIYYQVDKSGTVTRVGD